ncbi:MAG: NAD(P)H-dependent oxidoreductase subunit E, partial [Gammaproteobacteria bacterium]|nr:NAD(P)H-dependent oxidoreductase subunit E [Gammaproteobacteria bacterium]
MSRNIRALSARHSDDKTLFELLIDAAKPDGCLSEQQLAEISRQRPVSSAHLLATSSFYDFLNVNNQCKRAYICTGTSCMLQGKQTQLRSALLQNYQSDEIGEVKCLGHCYRGEAFIEGGHVLDVAQCYLEGKDNLEKIPFYTFSSVSVFSNSVDDIEQYYQSVLIDRKDIKSQLKISALRGRGGAAYPFADKMMACAKATGQQKYIVCNADEGDPGAFSDRYLLEQQAHSVLAGMLASAIACDASAGFIYVRAEYTQ